MVRRTFRVFAVAALLSLLAAPGWGQSDAGYDAYKQGDYATAHRVWKSRADGGDASAQYNLGLLYHYGLGVERQLGEAAKWYGRAAENGDADAQKAIGDLYVKGFWGKKDYAKATTWYRMAAEQGHAEAKKALRNLEAKRQVRPRQPARSNAPIPSLSPAPADTSVQPAVGVHPKTYEEIGFALTQTILNPTPAARDGFGNSVAISGGKVLIGAASDDAGAKNSGAAYLFDAATGNLLHIFLNPTLAIGDAFGHSVAISGDKLLFGAVRADDFGAKDSGAAYLFDAATGKLLHTFLNPTPAAGDGFSRVAIAGDKVLIGAWSDDAGAKDSGAAYLFLPGPTSPRQTAQSKSDYSRERQQYFQQMEKLSAQARYDVWFSYGLAGFKAYEEGNYLEAEKQYTAALKVAEQFSTPEERRGLQGMTLAVLAELYRAQGKYAEAKQLDKRVSAVEEWLREFYNGQANDNPDEDK